MRRRGMRQPPLGRSEVRAAARYGCCCGTSRPLQDSSMPCTCSDATRRPANCEVSSHLHQLMPHSSVRTAARARAELAYAKQQSEMLLHTIFCWTRTQAACCAERRRRRRREREAELVYAQQLEDLPLEDIAKEMQDSWQLKVR